MSYTRFDMKRKTGKLKYIKNFILILIIAIGLATLLFKVLSVNVKNTNGSNVEKNNKSSQDKSQIASNNKFIIVQGGIYSVKANANEKKINLAPYSNPFSIEEENKTRVFSGIYKEDSVEKVTKILNENKIDNAKITYLINDKDLCDNEIVEILNAQIKIMCKLCEKDVKSVNTDEVKKWSSELKKINAGAKNEKVLDSLKQYVSKYPKELTKDKVAENYEFMYSVINKIGQKQK